MLKAVVLLRGLARSGDTDKPKAAGGHGQARQLMGCDKARPWTAGGGGGQQDASPHHALAAVPRCVYLSIRSILHAVTHVSSTLTLLHLFAQHPHTCLPYRFTATTYNPFSPCSWGATEMWAGRPGG